MYAGCIEIREEPISELHRHVLIPNDFESRSVFDVREIAGALVLTERQLDRPYSKNYDSLENPMDWPALFDVSNWTIISAFVGGARVGGIIGAMDSTGVEMLEGRRDLLVIWDLRVSPGARRKGVASALFLRLEALCRLKHCIEIKAETQNTNVAACSYYAHQDCRLVEANHDAYPGVPDDVQLVWRKTVPA